MGGATCNSKTELKKGPWSREEDQKLLSYIDQHGHGSWRTLPTQAGLQRCGKSCRLRWTNYLRPDIKRGKFSTHEEKTIIRLHALLGNSWSAIAAHLPKRTDNEIKNYWNTRLKKRLTRMGIDPATHKPKNNPPGSAHSTHMAQWEAARLEAEARLARQLKLPLLRTRLLTSPPPRPHLAAPPPPCLDVLKVWQSSSIPSCFFSSTGSSSLESPTSTLNFSCNSLTLPTAGNWMHNDVISMDDYTQAQVAETDQCFYDCGLTTTAPPVDLASFNQASDVGGAQLVAEMEDTKNYWDYLLNLVSSPLMDY